MDRLIEHGWGAGVDVNPAGDRAAAEDRQRQEEARDLLTDLKNSPIDYPYVDVLPAGGFAVAGWAV